MTEIPDIWNMSDIRDISINSVNRRLDSGRRIYRVAGQEFLGNDCRKMICLRLPYWLDENLRDISKVSFMTPQEILRYLAADAAGGPKPGWRERYFGRGDRRG